MARHHEDPAARRRGRALVIGLRAEHEPRPLPCPRLRLRHGLLPFPRAPAPRRRREHRRDEHHDEQGSQQGHHLRRALRDHHRRSERAAGHRGVAAACVRLVRPGRLGGGGGRRPTTYTGSPRVSFLVRNHRAMDRVTQLARAPRRLSACRVMKSKAKSLGMEKSSVLMRVCVPRRQLYGCLRWRELTLLPVILGLMG